MKKIEAALTAAVREDAASVVMDKLINGPKGLKVSVVGEKVAPNLGHDATESIKTYIDDLVWDDASEGQASWSSQWEKNTEDAIKVAKKIEVTTLFPKLKTLEIPPPKKKTRKKKTRKKSTRKKS